MSLKQNLYEISYFMSAESVEESLNKLRERLESKGAMITQSANPEKRLMGYEIGGHKEAYFGTIKFVAKEEGDKKFGEIFEGQKSFLRHILVKYKMRENRRKERRVITSAPNIEHKESVEQATNIEKIDKKLEELLGK